jgi:hypothetical protein
VTDAAPSTHLLPPAAGTGRESAALLAFDRLLAAHGPEALLAAKPTASVADDLALVVRMLCAEAHRSNPGDAARMLIGLHGAWPTLPAVQNLRSREIEARLVARVVTLAIVEFYQPTVGASDATLPPPAGIEP